MKPTSTFLTALAAAAISSAAAGGARNPRHQSGRHGPGRPGLPGLQPLRQRRMAQGQPDSGRPVLLGILHDPRGDQPRAACTRSSRRSRRRPTRPAPTTRRSATSTSTCMDEAAIEAQGITPLKAELAAIDKIADRRRAPGRDRAPPDDGRQRRLQLRIGPGPQERERGHRRRLPGRPGTARPRLLPQDRRRVEEAARPVPRPRHEDVRPHGRRRREGRREREDGHGPRDEARRGVDDARRAPRPGQDLQPQDHDRAGAADAELLLDGVPEAARRSAASAAINVGQPKYFEAVSAELAATPLADWKTYLRWHLVHSAAPSLSKAFVDESFDFYEKTLQGTPENEVRWKRCVARDRQRDRLRPRQGLRARLFPAGVQGARRRDGQGPDRRAARGPHDAALDGRGHAQGRDRQARHVRPEDRLPLEVARLLGPEDRPRAVRRSISSAPTSSSTSAT